MSVNKVILVGRLGADPEKLVTGSGKSVTKFNLATSEQWKDSNGQKQERTEWHRIVVWGKQAENCKEYLKKGRTVFVEGRLQTRSFEDKQGVKRSITEITAQSVLFVGSAQGKPAAISEESTLVEPVGHEPDMGPAIKDDDVPF